MAETKCFIETKLGKLYQADCIAWLKSLPSGKADLIFTDPPYSIKKAEWDTFESQQHYVEWCMEWIREAHRVLSDIGTIYIMGFSEILAHIKVAASPMFLDCKWLVWYYRNKANMGKDWGRSHESILHLRKSRIFTFNIDPIRIPYNKHTLNYPEHPQAATSQYANGKKYVWQPNPHGAKPRDVLEMPTLCNTTKEKTLHPTQKPEELIQKFILASTNEGDLVIDPFGGAGTTYIVCERCNRRWLGCEINEDYCDIIEKRLKYPEQFTSERSNIKQEKLTKRREDLRFGRDKKNKVLIQEELF
jgi:site-specific DNA-methyltransferase (adenine-specific)